MSGNNPDGEITEHKLVHGWASAPRVRVRQAVASDLPAVAKLAALAGVQTAGMALCAGLRGGWDGFTRCMAEQFFAHRDDPLPAYLAAALVLVAEHRDRGVVGALIATLQLMWLRTIWSSRCIPSPTRANAASW